MTSKFVTRSTLILFVLTVFAASLSAQRAEVYPNAGFVWPDTMNNGQRLKSDAIWGLKAGVFLDQNVQLEGSFGYMNHFEARQPPNPCNPAFGIVQPSVRGLLYDVNTTYNFGERQFLNHRISPFITVGAGGLTTHMPNASSVFVQGGGNVIGPNGAVMPNPGRSKIMEDRDTFFTLNYGAGVKFLNVAGPMGFRFDVRGRTLPNFFGETTTWFEPTAGLTFSWGEEIQGKGRKRGNGDEPHFPVFLDLLSGSANASASRCSADNQAVDTQDDDCAEDRKDEPRGFAFRVPAYGASNQTSKERASNTEQHRNYDSAGITSRHQEFGQCTNDQTNDDHPKQMHASTSFS
jgi:hypothetical protein